MSKKGKTAIYPGSFDPVTNGHLDILNRTAELFEKVIIAVVINPNKKSKFSVEKRLELLKKSIGDASNVEIDSFHGLLVDYVKQKKGDVIIRGLRAVSDFEYEFQMAHINKKLAPEIETVFISADNRYTFISSNAIKEVGHFGGDIKDMVPECVAEELEKINK
ncbi:MAG: pantetheine-phosphate adenylyltransferase [Candidatus Muiribacteriota bacterium]